MNSGHNEIVAIAIFCVTYLLPPKRGVPPATGTPHLCGSETVVAAVAIFPGRAQGIC
jgi:hypothetical protein